MRRIAINLCALLVIGVGGSYLGGVEAAQASPIFLCTSPAGSNGCTCTSGDGRYTCQGDHCTSDAISCSSISFG